MVVVDDALFAAAKQRAAAQEVISALLAADAAPKPSSVLGAEGEGGSGPPQRVKGGGP